MPYVRRTLEELIHPTEPAWPMVRTWLEETAHPVECLPPSETAGASLESIQVTTRSPLGAVVLHTGGILVDHGWLRLLGSGHPRLPRTLPGWNFACGLEEADSPPQWLLVADDVLGGFFALNGGRFAAPGHTIWYFAPDTLEWEDTDKGYSDFLFWCFTGDLERFYTPYRWHGWQSDVASLAGDQGFHIAPPLFTAGAAIHLRSRRAVPLQELFSLHVGVV